MITSLPKLLSAAVITLKLLSASLIIGLFIGFLFAVLRLNKNPFINKFAYGYSYLFRGTPLLVQIFIIYYGLGQIEWLRSTFLWVILKEPNRVVKVNFSLGHFKRTLLVCNYCICLKYRGLYFRNFKISFSNYKTWNN